ncbi:hypothetical protein HHL19_26140 [Streptomyces sp. R302]|uniref:hypothetical protein n=1 Tax=unclassified Streptomyces TaxID=2593676 RepID=UPI00145E9A6A|nr:MULTISPECIES: hypothetical protein [unclassified Streptomyces]NML53680.1 hypothetical protein [Streptomyces sp. R301]NML82041.1 hypothetical protein [Streptomyces sp. R302]
MKPPSFRCPVPEHPAACILEALAVREAVLCEAIGTSVVVHTEHGEEILEVFLPMIRAGHPTRHVTLDDNVLVVWPETQGHGRRRAHSPREE